MKFSGIHGGLKHIMVYIYLYSAFSSLIIDEKSIGVDIFGTQHHVFLDNWVVLGTHNESSVALVGSRIAYHDAKSLAKLVNVRGTHVYQLVTIDRTVQTKYHDDLTIVYLLLRSMFFEFKL